MKEALKLALEYMNECLEEHDAKYQRHPATEAERNNILDDIEIVKEALRSQSRIPWVGLTDEQREACTQSPFTEDNYQDIEDKLKELNT